MLGFGKRDRKTADDRFEGMDESPLSQLMSDQADLNATVRKKKFRGAGGTSGGVMEFLVGLGMVVGGGYLILQQVSVSSGYWTLLGFNGFGLSLIPLLFGIGMLFFNGRSMLGKLLTFGGAIAILFGVIANLNIHFRQTSLFNTLIMFGLLAGGLGLVARSIKPHGEQGEEES